LQSYASYLQADAYAGYQGLYESGNITEVACWAHTRRKFYEAAIATQKAGRAAEALQRIANIYRVEWACKEMNDEERKAHRELLESI
jgi:transposase